MLGNTLLKSINHHEESVEHLDYISIINIAEVTGKCLRCGRRLTNKNSVIRGLGKVCASKVGLDTFSNDMLANDKEWDRREEFLKKGGERDFGVNWKYAYEGKIYNLRVSVRYNNDFFEVYGVYDRDNKEFVIYRTKEIRSAFKVACESGPLYTAIAERNMKK